jgi:hypothetical protein
MSSQACLCCLFQMGLMDQLFIFKQLREFSLLRLDFQLGISIKPPTWSMEWNSTYTLIIIPIMNIHLILSMQLLKQQSICLISWEITLQKWMSSFWNCKENSCNFCRFEYQGVSFYFLIES